MRKHILKYPYTTGAGVRLESVEIRRLTRGDVRKATQYSKDDFDQENFLLARMCGLLPEDLDQMDIADSKVLLDFFRGVVAGESEPESV